MPRKKKDISAKNQYAIEKERDILQDVMNGAENMHLVYMDRDFNFVRVNETYAKTCGYKPEEMIGKNHFALYPDEENEAIFKRVRDTGVSAEFLDKSFVFPDQPERGVTYWDWTLNPVKDETGEVKGLVFSLVETTERKKAEEEIQNLAKFQSENPSPVLRINKKGTFLYCNDAAKKILKTSKCTVGEAAPEGWRKFVDAAFTYEKRQEFEEQIDERVFVFAMSPVTDYVNVYGHDITKRKKTEEELRKSEQRYRSYIEVTGELGWTTNAEGEVVEDLPSWRNFTGQTYEQIKGSGWSKALHPSDLENTLRVWRRAINEKSRYEIEYRIRRRDGVYRKFMVRGVPVFDKDGTLREWVGICIDITKRKEAEEALKKSEWLARQHAQELEELQEKLEDKAAEIEEYATRMEELAEERAMKLRNSELLAAIGATAGMVGHDIRNPLQAILGNLYLVESDLDSIPEREEKESMKESIGAIRKSVEYINKIVQDLQDYARPLRSIAQETDFEELCNDVLFKCAYPKNVDVSIQIDKAVKTMVVDPIILRRILTNLMNNAVQAMPNGGRLEIHAYQESGETVIMVKDSGVGIPEKNRDKLFTPLFTTKSKGQGFGLPVVKRMTEALGGTVNFESEVGKGAKFIVRLPHTPKNR